MTTVLLVAAEPREFAGLLRRCRQVRRLRLPPVRFARTGLLNGSRLLLVAHGPGKLAAEAAAAALARERPDAILSAGWCGALDPALDCGDIFVAERVDGFAATRPATALPFRTGLLLSADRVVSSVEEKRRLRAEGAAAVEMEAAAVARRAAEAGLPFYCIRAVMDRADQGFLLDLNTLRDADGRFSRARILRAALGRPRRCLPELLRLARQSRRAARALGDFLADCRF